MRPAKATAMTAIAQEHELQESDMFPALVSTATVACQLASRVCVCCVWFGLDRRGISPEAQAEGVGCFTPRFCAIGVRCMLCAVAFSSHGQSQSKDASCKEASNSRNDRCRHRLAFTVLARGHRTRRTIGENGSGWCDRERQRQRECERSTATISMLSVSCCSAYGVLVSVRGRRV